MSCGLLGLAVAVWAQTGAQEGHAQRLRVAVTEHAPPMSYRDTRGQLTGFSVDVARALCAEMRVVCDFQSMRFDMMSEALKSGQVDFAAASFLDTPERRSQLVLAKPYFRSVTLWLSPAGVQPGRTNTRVLVVKGSAQERFANRQGWVVVAVTSHADLAPALTGGRVDAALIPMMTATHLLTIPAVQALAWVQKVMSDPELGGAASFGISPGRADLKPLMDAALDRLMRNGEYDRINSQYLSLRVY